MPSKWTFQMKPVSKLINRYLTPLWVDPFAGKYSPADITNDIEGRGAQFQMDGLEFLRNQKDNSCNGVLFDPPYSIEQCLRLYTPKYRGTAGRAEYWIKCKNEISRIIALNGITISFCWDSNGMGVKRGFEIIEILLICHGALHNDTIVTIERMVDPLRADRHNQEITTKLINKNIGYQNCSLFDEEE